MFHVERFVNFWPQRRGELRVYLSQSSGRNAVEISLSLQNSGVLIGFAPRKDTVELFIPGELAKDARGT